MRDPWKRNSRCFVLKFLLLLLICSFCSILLCFELVRETIFDFIISSTKDPASTTSNTYNESVNSGFISSNTLPSKISLPSSQKEEYEQDPASRTVPHKNNNGKHTKLHNRNHSSNVKQKVKSRQEPIPIFSAVLQNDVKWEELRKDHGVNNSYHMQSEVESIIHVPSEAKIVVSFKTSVERICKKPRIFGRLSGKYLTMIYWDSDAFEKMDHEEYDTDNVTAIQRKAAFDNTTQTDVITGYYSLPSKGKYYIEIIGLMCNDFSFAYDFNSICLENVDHNHLTAPGAYVDVIVTSKELNHASVFQSSSSNAANGAAELHGFWKWSNDTLEPLPLTTRYQRQNCRDDNATITVCAETGSLDRFLPYRFEWIMDGTCQDEKLELQNFTFMGEENTGFNETFKLCTGGQSHARELEKHLQFLVDFYNMSNIEIGQVPMQYPRDMRHRRWEFDRALHCNVVLVGLGQWSAGRKPGFPAPATTFPVYRKELEDGILSWKSSGINFLFRKTHYNPLGDIKNTCPPTDWRSPPVIDGYNEIARSLAQKHNLMYLDTGSLMDPMWDSAEDFCHYRGIEGRTEALYFLQKILQLNKRFNWIKPIKKDMYPISKR